MIKYVSYMSEMLKEKAKKYFDEIKDSAYKLQAGIDSLSNNYKDFVNNMREKDFKMALDTVDKLKNNLNKILLDIIFPIDINLKMINILSDIPSVFSKTGNFLIGGIGDNTPHKSVNQEQLKMGIKVEMEHTKDPIVAEEIAVDHLTEIPDYYTRLRKMEEVAKKELGIKG